MRNCKMSAHKTTYRMAQEMQHLTQAEVVMGVKDIRIDPAAVRDNGLQIYTTDTGRISSAQPQPMACPARAYKPVHCGYPG